MTTPKVGDKVRTKINIFQIRVGMEGTIIRIPCSYAERDCDVSFGPDDGYVWNGFNFKDLQFAKKVGQE